MTLTAGMPVIESRIPDHLLDLSELLAWGARRNYSIMAAFGRYALIAFGPTELE